LRNSSSSSEVIASKLPGSLWRAPADQLAVDARAVMVFRDDHVQPAERLHALAQMDVGAAAGHVCGRRDAPGLAGRRHDLRSLLVVSTTATRAGCAPPTGASGITVGTSPSTC
jgi:hypothetical protein